MPISLGAVLSPRCSVLPWLPALLVAASGCAASFMAGSQPVTGPPASPLAVCTIPQCTLVMNNSTIAGPTTQRYYVAQQGTGLVLYELDAAGKGALITNHWSDAQGDHFFTYVRTSHGWQYDFPRDPSQTPERLVYTKGTYAAGAVGTNIRITAGNPAARCPIQCQWYGPRPGGAAPVAAAPPVPTTPCSTDTDCPGNLVCASGQCAPPAAGMPTGGCSKDTDCPGDQVCQNGSCASESGTPAPAPAPAGGCAKDTDCPGDQVCQDGSCVSESGTPAPAPAPAGECAKDTDCPGVQVCREGSCVDSDAAAPPTPPPSSTEPPIPTAPEPTPPEPPPTPTPPPEPPPTPQPAPQPVVEQPPQPEPAPTPEPSGPEKKRHLYWLITSIAAGAGAIGTGVWMGLCGPQGEDAAKAHDRETFDSKVLQQKIALGLTVGLGAVSATALVLYLVTGTTVQPEKQSAGLSVGPGQAGLSAFWRF